MTKAFVNSFTVNYTLYNDETFIQLGDEKMTSGAAKKKFPKKLSKMCNHLCRKKDEISPDGLWYEWKCIFHDGKFFDDFHTKGKHFPLRKKVGKSRREWINHTTILFKEDSLSG